MYVYIYNIFLILNLLIFYLIPVRTDEIIFSIPTISNMLRLSWYQLLKILGLLENFFEKYFQQLDTKFYRFDFIWLSFSFYVQVYNLFQTKSFNVLFFFFFFPNE